MPRKTLIRAGACRCWFAVALAVAGCSGGDESSGDRQPGATLPRASVTLRVAVVSDEPLKRAIDRLRGEWTALTDGDYETLNVAQASDAADADLLVFPSRAIGELCEADRLRPMRRSALRSETLRFDDFLPLVRDHEVVYGQRVMALPLGCPTPLLLGEIGGAGVAPPADDERLALAYLAWASPYAVHSSREATLFDADTFRPRLAAPPFVRALRSFVSATDGPSRTELAWPDRDAPLDPTAEVAALPGADAAYNDLSEAWEPLGEAQQRATLLASSGRLLGVTTASRNAATAFRLAAWLAGPENGLMLSTASDHVAVCRGSMARAVDLWRMTDDREAGKRFASATAEALRRSRFLLAPRLPGAEEYLRTLGERIQQALAGEPAASVLEAAAGDWEAISTRRGRDAQRAAYGRSINVAGAPAPD